MKTESSQFCQEYAAILRSLPQPLRSVIDRMETGGRNGQIHNPLAALNEIRHRLKSLQDKIESQQAYLLIFGPLKSGKSTLMNAISGAYVSEVTSLPGYPCLVYVSHDEQKNCSVTRYNGREASFSDEHVLHDLVEDSHVALALRIRETEDSGAQFDPRIHFPEAIRRVDVKTPVPNLRESGTVLVDTPGLYCRMNFGYDLLTREFRDSAACAVFVVKTDNLFLEQVFAEFNQLLGMFSRIFLVVNVDSSKRDLAPDGTLHPSAESQDPQRIIQAFKNLSMAGPMRHAFEEGRLRLHAIDLLNAASAYLQRPAKNGNGHGNGHAGADENGSENGDTGIVLDPHVERQQQAFEAFLTDLSDYLNSHEYMMEFQRDSLRQGRILCEEMRAVSETPEIERLREEQEQLSHQLAVNAEQRAASERLAAVDWTAVFDAARLENIKRADEASRPKADEMAAEMKRTLERWFESSDSLKALDQEHWKPIAEASSRELAERIESHVRSIVSSAMGGANPSTEQMSELLTVDFDVRPIQQLAQENFGAGIAHPDLAPGLKVEDIPVRKSFLDLLLFRRKATVRTRLFGAPDQLSNEIPPELKKKRLREPARAAFAAAIDEHTQAKFPTAPREHAAALLEAYVGRFRNVMTEQLQAKREQFDALQAELQPRFEANRLLLEAMAMLEDQVVGVTEAMELLIATRHISGMQAEPSFQPSIDSADPSETDALVTA